MSVEIESDRRQARANAVAAETNVYGFGGCKSYCGSAACSDVHAAQPVAAQQRGSFRRNHGAFLALLRNLHFSRTALAAIIDELVDFLPAFDAVDIPVALKRFVQ